MSKFFRKFPPNAKRSLGQRLLENTDIGFYIASLLMFAVVVSLVAWTISRMP